MKYLTKYWYNKMHCPNFHHSLIIDERVNEFSQKLYNEIYNNQKKEYLKEKDFITSYKKFKKHIKEKESDIDNHSDELLKIRYEECKKLFLDGLTLQETFDSIQNSIINDLKTKLPSNILSQVKDIRVLALDYASKDVYNMIKEYCEGNQRYVSKIANDYYKIEREQFKDNPIEFVKQYFHDCYILDCEQNKNNLTITVDNNGYNSKTNIVFKNCRILLDEDIKYSYWIYREVYKIDGIYEVHILTENENNLRELVIRCEEIVLK